MEETSLSSTMQNPLPGGGHRNLNLGAESIGRSKSRRKPISIQFPEDAGKHYHITGCEPGIDGMRLNRIACWISMAC
jgi:hypothetical protein